MSNSNMPIVTVKQFSNIIKEQMAEGNTRAIFGIGKGGIGKSESIESLAKQELGIGYVDIRLLLYTETDLKGIPYPNADHTMAVWLQNNILPVAERDGDEGILVFDEVTSCAKSVRTAAYQLLQERRLGEYKLPEKWQIICLGNGEEDGGDFQGLEGNFVNRGSIYQVISDVDTWKQWAIDHGVNPLVTGYVSWKPGDLHTYNPDSESDMQFASPRSWKAVSDILNNKGYHENDELTRLRVLGNLGTLVGNQFMAFCKFKDQSVDSDDIVSGRVTEVPDNMDKEAIFMTIQGIVAKMVGEIKHDAVNNKVNGRIQYTEKTVQHCANGVRWMLKLKALEHQMLGIKDFIGSNPNVPALILSPAFKEYCPELWDFCKDHAEAITFN